MPIDLDALEQRAKSVNASPWSVSEKLRLIAELRASRKVVAAISTERADFARDGCAHTAIVCGNCRKELHDVEAARRLVRDIALYGEQK